MYNLFSIAPAADKTAISRRDIVAALTGAMLFLVLLHFARDWYRKR